jgi:hypothetical protein
MHSHSPVIDLMLVLPCNMADPLSAATSMVNIVRHIQNGNGTAAGTALFADLCAAVFGVSANHALAAATAWADRMETSGLLAA